MVIILTSNSAASCRTLGSKSPGVSRPPGNHRADLVHDLPVDGQSGRGVYGELKGFVVHWCIMIVIHL